MDISDLRLFMGGSASVFAQVRDRVNEGSSLADALTATQATQVPPSRLRDRHSMPEHDHPHRDRESK